MVSRVIVLAAGLYLLWPGGVKAVVRNAGSGTMHDVRLLVTGRTYSLGDLQPKEIRSVRVNPTGESSITIRYTEGAGAPKVVDADCYVEAGYSGSISVDVGDVGVTRKVEGGGMGP